LLPAWIPRGSFFATYIVLLIQDLARVTLHRRNVGASPVCLLVQTTRAYARVIGNEADGTAESSLAVEGIPCFTLPAGLFACVPGLVPRRSSRAALFVFLVQKLTSGTICGIGSVALPTNFG
jgi:hypothetical protein